MKKQVSVFIDGYNLYHAIVGLKKSYLKWVCPYSICKHYLNAGEEIKRIVFFTAPPIHKPKDVQMRYKAFVTALQARGVHIVEGCFKKKLVTIHTGGNTYTRPSHEEKETDVNLSLAILEDAYERISDRIIIITNDSDISPAIRMAKLKNPQLMADVISPPLPKNRKPNHDLAFACGKVNRNKNGQVYIKTTVIKEYILEQSIMPEIITLANGELIHMPKEYQREV